MAYITKKNMIVNSIEVYLGLFILAYQVQASINAQWDGGCNKNCNYNPGVYCQNATTTCKDCACEDGPTGEECRRKCKTYTKPPTVNNWEGGCNLDCQYSFLYFCEKGSKTCMECANLCNEEEGSEKCMENCAAYLQIPAVPNDWNGCPRNCGYDIFYFCEPGSKTCMECPALCDIKATHYSRSKCSKSCYGYMETFMTTASPPPTLSPSPPTPSPPPTPSETPTPSSSTDVGSKTVTIVICCIVTVLVIGVVIAVIMFYCRRRSAQGERGGIEQQQTGEQLQQLVLPHPTMETDQEVRQPSELRENGGKYPANPGLVTTNLENEAGSCLDKSLVHTYQ